MKSVLALLLAALLLLTGCGSKRPTEAELSKALRSGTTAVGQQVSFSKQEADCIAHVLETSKLSDEALRAIADKKKDYDASARDKDVAADLSGTADCIQRPTVAQVSAAFQKGVGAADNSSSVLKLNKTQSDCVADVLVNKSKMSNADLYQVTTSLTLDTGDKNAAIIGAVQKDLTKCGA